MITSEKNLSIKFGSTFSSKTVHGGDQVKVLDTVSYFDATLIVYRHPQRGFGVVDSKEIDLNAIIPPKKEKEVNTNWIDEYPEELPVIAGVDFILSAAPASDYFPVDGKKAKVIGWTLDHDEKVPVAIGIFVCKDGESNAFGALYHYGYKKVAKN